MNVGFRSERALGYQQITDLSVAVGLTIPSGCGLIMIQAEAQSVRWRDDGVDPTASVGMPLPATGELIYTADPNSMEDLKFIEQTAGAILNVCYYRP